MPLILAHHHAIFLSGSKHQLYARNGARQTVNSWQNISNSAGVASSVAANNQQHQRKISAAWRSGNVITRIMKQKQTLA